MVKNANFEGVGGGVPDGIFSPKLLGILVTPIPTKLVTWLLSQGSLKIWHYWAGPPTLGMDTYLHSFSSQTSKSGVLSTRHYHVNMFVLYSQ